MKKLILLLCAVFMLTAQVPALAQARVYNAPRQCRRLLTKQFAAGANVFTIVDPTKNGTPLSLTSATGTSGGDGNISIILQAGYTPPVTLTVFVWQEDLVTPANAGWTRIGANAAGYAIATDALYTRVTFTIEENTPFIIMSSTAVTGNVYTDSKANVNNNNTVAGY